jgi:hypothetical protein
MKGKIHYYNSWFFKRFKLINKSLLTSGHVHFNYRPKAWMNVYFLLVNLTKVAYLTICQIEYIIKLYKAK